VIADTHYYNYQPDYFKTIQEKKDEWGISFVIHVGDITQNGQMSEFNIATDDFFNCTLPVFMVPGNHDLYYEGFDIYKSKFGRTIYDFKIGKTQFIFLDTANGTLGNLQKNWLEDRLKNTNANNIFIFTHYCLFDSEYLSYTDWSFPEEKYYLIDLFDKYNVNYYICGHLHLNAQSEIRGVDYITIKNMSSNAGDVFLKVSVNPSGVFSSWL
jgi:predicted phosphodiesterase